MELLTGIQLILITLITLYLIFEYSAKTIPLWIKAICFISWFVSFVIIILVPLDVFYSLRQGYDPYVSTETETEEKTEVLPPSDDNDETFKGMMIGWQIVYWTSFIITWLILPNLQQYLSAGDFPPKQKLMMAIKANLKTYAAMACCGVIFIVYLKLTGRIGEEGILQFLITFSNSYGLFLIIVCLSYSLVSLPKRCLQHSKQDLNLKMHQIQVAVVSDQRQELLFDIEELIKTVEALSRRKDVSEQDKETLNKILSEVPQKLLDEAKQTIRRSSIAGTGASDKFSKKQVDALNKKMYRKLTHLRRLETEYEVTLQRAFFLEDILSSQSAQDWRSKQSYSAPSIGLCEGLVSSIEYNWHKHILKRISFIGGVLLIGLSILVFFAEILNSYDFQLFNVNHFLVAGGGAFAKSQLLCLFSLLYISICVYSALFRMKLSGRFGLYHHHQTDAPSLIIASLYNILTFCILICHRNLLRVTSPMIFNFLQMIKIKNTAFQEVMGDVQILQSFMKYIPILLVLLILCNAFNVFQRFLKSIGLAGRHSFNEDATQEKLEDGKKLLNKTRGKALSSSSTAYTSLKSRASDDVNDLKNVLLNV